MFYQPWAEAGKTIKPLLASVVSLLIARNQRFA